MTSTVRSVTVRMNAEVGKYIADMKAAGAATDSAFDKASVGLASTNRELGVTRNRLADVTAGAQGANTSLTGMSRGTAGLQRDVTGLDRGLGSLDRSTKNVDSSINQLTGRLRLVADLTAVLGPGLIPIAAVGVPALAGMNAQLTSMVLAGGAVAIAMQGVPDAIGAVAAYDLEPTAANLEAAQAALGKLGPDALAFVGAFREFRPVLGDIRDATAAGIFPGLVQSLDNLEERGPLAAKIMRDVGQAVGDAAATSTASLASDRWTGFFDYLRQQAPESIAKTTRTLGDLGHGVAELIMSLDPGADRFESWLGRVADGFDDWASSDAGRRDVEQFLDYAAKNGPKVEAAFVATADALTDVVQAGAPLGGYVLDGLTGVLKVAGAIADSDLGTPLLAAAAGLAVYNRGLKVTQAVGATALGGRFSAWSKDVKTSIPTLGQFGTVMATAGQSAQYTTDKTNAARASVGGFIRQVGPGAAVVGGLALATTGLGDKLGVTNTASLALMGTMGGPWGVAIGAGVGATLDLAAANDDLAAAMDNAREAAETGTLEQMRAAYDQLDSTISNANWISDATGKTASARNELDALGRSIDNFEAGAVGGGESLAALLGPASGVSRQMQIAAQSVEQFAASFAGLNSALDRSGSLINYEQALDDLTDSIKENGNAWNAGTDAGRANLAARNALVGRAIERSNTLKEAGDALGAQRILTRAISDLREFGNASPEARAAMKFLIDELRDLNGREANPKLDLDDKGFRGKSRGAKNDLEVLDGSTAIPGVGLEGGEFTRNYRRTRGDLTSLDAFFAVPKAGLNDSPFMGIQRGVVGLLRSLDGTTATPRANLLDQASGPARSIQAAINSIPAFKNSTVTVTTIRETINRVSNVVTNSVRGLFGDRGLFLPDVRAYAAGGMDRADSHIPEFAGPGPTRVWREPETGGESYIPHADDHRRPRAKAITEATVALFGGQVEWYAEGGMNGAADRAARGLGATRSFDRGDAARANRDAVNGLRELARASGGAKEALKKEQAQRERLTQARSQVISTARDGLRSDLFGATDSPWGSMSPFGTLRGDIEAGKDYEQAVRKLRRMGLDEDALAAGAGTLESARYLAGLGKRRVREFEDLYDRRERVTNQAAKLAGNAAYGPELRETNKRIDRLTRAVKDADKGNREGHRESGNRTARALDGAANKARRRASGPGGRPL
ncbi:hypothetical protein [Nocardioides sp. AX2bis]|uniref:hypothetical protein n=1 Tax=Nocardioides sp. AX2bis TaxID=2653157 RepID=UPI0012F0F839|nr:hypothetical protein [Nocardioides sp. AX2bis]VXC43977.1 conserved hypothetical protein [Nocardioides sp. AX2bis]